MDLSHIIKAYDVRGIVPDDFDEDIARRIGAAFATFVDSDEVIVGYDADATVGDVLISEVYYHNTETPRLSRDEPEVYEFVELYNQSDTAVDLSSWRVFGDIDGVGLGVYQAKGYFWFNAQYLGQGGLGRHCHIDDVRPPRNIHFRFRPG